MDRMSSSTTELEFRRPHATSAPTAETEQVFSKAHGSLRDKLLTVISKKLTGEELQAAMRDVGRKVADARRPDVKGKNRKDRIKAALRILRELGGAASFHAGNGRDFIRGNGWPFEAASSRHPEACLIAESLLTEMIGAAVKRRCQHEQNSPCWFEVSRSA